MSIISKINLGEIKAVIHILNVIFILISLPQSFLTLILAYLYAGIMYYVYFFLKNEDEMPKTAMLGFIILTFLFTGYIEAL